MRKRTFAVVALLIFVLSLGFSFTATVQQAEADYCDNCWGFCLCQVEFWRGRMVNGVCDLNACTQCSGEGIPCL